MSYMTSFSHMANTAAAFAGADNSCSFNGNSAITADAFMASVFVVLSPALFVANVITVVSVAFVVVIISIIVIAVKKMCRLSKVKRSLVQ